MQLSVTNARSGFNLASTGEPLTRTRAKDNEALVFHVNDEEPFVRNESTWVLWRLVPFTIDPLAATDEPLLEARLSGDVSTDEGETVGNGMCVCMEIHLAIGRCDLIQGRILRKPSDGFEQVRQRRPYSSGLRAVGMKIDNDFLQILSLLRLPLLIDNFKGL